MCLGPNNNEGRDRDRDKITPLMDFAHWTCILHLTFLFFHIPSISWKM